MTIEHACVRVVPKPWGSDDLRPWHATNHAGVPIGELWFQRRDIDAPESALLLKLLFTKEPLSIQVHPDDVFARSIGLAHGKTEAWYILSATADAKVAVGLKRALQAPELRAAIEAGSIADLVQWRSVRKDDFVFVPAGTIHAIGSGLVIAEIQQRSDTTFRLYDYGRQRDLHVEDAVAAAKAGVAECQTVPVRLTDARTVLVADQHFVFERIDLVPDSDWEIDAECEAWLFVLEGRARIGPIAVSVGETIFLGADRAGIKVKSDGLKGLLAYLGPVQNLRLLRKSNGRSARSLLHLKEAQL